MSILSALARYGLAASFGAVMAVVAMSWQDTELETASVQPKAPPKASTKAPAEDAGPIEKAGRAADELIEKAGLSSGSVEEITEKAKELGAKAAETAGLTHEGVEEVTEKAKELGAKAKEKAEVALEKVKETAGNAISKAEELADKGKEAASGAADGLGKKLKADSGG